MDIIEKITELGFQLDNYSNGKHECICPFCSHTRKPIHQKMKCAAVWIEPDFVTYNCVHCMERGWFCSDKPSSKPVYTQPKAKIPSSDNLELAADFFKSRGISLETARKLGVYVDVERYKTPMLAFPYFKGGRLVNIKYRGITEKTFFQESNPEPVVYNYDKCFGKNEVIVVEGEMDVLAFAEVGIENVISVPSGSIGNKVEEDYKGAKFDFLKVSQPLFDIANRIILALDNDSPGQFMTEALTSRLGKEKCWLVDWSVYRVKGKDANDFLIKDKSILQDALNLAKPIPLRGIVNAQQDMEIFENYVQDGIRGAISSGFSNMDSLIKFERGNFVTVTGYPGSGKSLFVTDLIMNLAELSNIKTLYCAFENTPNQLKKKWLQLKLGFPLINATEEMIAEARKYYDFLGEHFYILQDYTTSLTVEQLLDMAEQAVRRYDIGCLVIDPFNKLTYAHSKNFTEDVGDLLTKMIAFAKRNNVLTFLVAHPAKPSEKRLSAQSTPSGFDISGSANFLNMSDVILTVHRKQDEYGNKSKRVRVMISKVRDTDYGHEGSCYFEYNPETGRYMPSSENEFVDENLTQSQQKQGDNEKLTTDYLFNS